MIGPSVRRLAVAFDFSAVISDILLAILVVGPEKILGKGACLG